MKLTGYNSQVQPGNIGDARVQAFGDGGAAQAALNIGNMQGNTLKGIANFAAKIAEERQTTDVTAAQTEYAKRVSDMLYNEQSGLMNRQLKEADGISLAYQDGERKIRQDIQKEFKLAGKGLTAFNTMCDRDYAGHWGRLNQYEFNEAQKNKKIVTDNALIQISNEAQTLYNDVSMMSDALGKMRATIDANYFNMGKDYCDAYFRQSAANLVTSSLNVAVRKNDMAGADVIMNNFGYLVPPSQLSTYAKAVQEYTKQNRLIADTDRLYETYGKNIRGAFEAIREEAKQTTMDIPYPENGSVKEKAASLAVWVQNNIPNAKVPAAIIFGQWFQETAADGTFGSSRLAKEDFNLGGLTQTESNGIKQPDGGNYYRHYNSYQEFAKSYINNFIRHYAPPPGGVINTPEEYATWLYDNGYFGGHGNTREERIANYAAGIRKGMAVFNEMHPQSSNDNISIKEREKAYEAKVDKEIHIKNIMDSEAIRRAETMLVADPNADPRNIAMTIAGPDVELATTITNYLTQKKDKIRQQGLPIAAMDEVTRMLMYDDAFQSEGNLIAFMQSKGFNDTQISKGRDLWKDRLDGTGPFAIKNYSKYVSAAVPKSGNQQIDKLYEIELNQFGLDWIRSYRRKNHAEPTSEDLEAALNEKYFNTKIVLQSGGEEVSFIPRTVSNKGIVSVDVSTWTERDPNNPSKMVEHEMPGFVRVEYRDGTVVHMPIAQFKTDILKEDVNANGWLGSAERPNYDVNNATP